MTQNNSAIPRTTGPLVVRLQSLRSKGLALQEVLNDAAIGGRSKEIATIAAAADRDASAGKADWGRTAPTAAGLQLRASPRAGPQQWLNIGLRQSTPAQRWRDIPFLSGGGFSAVPGAASCAWVTPSSLLYVRGCAAVQPRQLDNASAKRCRNHAPASSTALRAAGTIATIDTKPCGMPA